MTRAISLRSLLSDCPGARLVSGTDDVLVTRVTQDSRQILAGGLFVAIAGLERDGHDFIPAAVEAGATVIVTERLIETRSDVALVLVPSARAALADLAAAFWDHPSRKMTLIGVTGTDGKTSTTQLIGAILRAAGRSVGWLTTEGIRIGEQARSNSLDHTTPEAPAVQEILAEMVEAGVEIAILEVSSHALSLDRVRGCAFDVAVFTNLSPEHINFHGSLEAYRAAKARLLSMLQPSAANGPSYAAVNRDDASAATMIAACQAPVVTYGLEGEADFSATEIHLDAHGSSFTVRTPAESFHVSTRLLGRFNVLNWLAAIAATSGLGATASHVQQAARLLEPVRGRMERVDAGQPFLVVVDFAHTPQALETALRTLRPHTQGRLMALFGQAGGRDPANRPAMGKLAAQLTDFFLITMDDPIHEDPTVIAASVADGAAAAGAQRGRDFEIELDRRAAIQRLIAQAQPGDTILLAGKGHEQRMLVGNAKIPWNDADEAHAAIQRGMAL